MRIALPRCRQVYAARRCHHTRTRGWHSPCLRVPLQPLQVGSHLRGMLIAQVAVFLQRLVDDVFQLRRNIGIQPNRRTAARFRMASKIIPKFRRETATRPSPSRTAPPRTRTDRCAHPVPCPRPVPATCRRSFPARPGTGQVLLRQRRLRVAAAIWLANWP